MECSDGPTDGELLERTWRTYIDEFSPSVGELVHPSGTLETEEQLTAIAKNFMFFYALGSVAGAQAVSEEFGRETDTDRVQGLVDTVAEINGDDEFEASASRVAEDVQRG